MNKFDSIIFDLDGTLWTTIDSCVKVLAEVKKKYSDILYDITPETVEGAMGLPFEENVKRYYGYLEKEKGVKYAKEAFENNAKNLFENGGTLYPNAEATIKKLAESFKLYIVSNCMEDYMQAFLRSSGLKDYFCDYESHGKTGLSKGENIKLVMQRNNLKNSIYVGDTIGDKTAADFAGIPFAYASYGFGEVEEYDYKLHNIADLIEIAYGKEKGGDYSVER